MGEVRGARAVNTPRKPAMSRHLSDRSCGTPRRPRRAAGGIGHAKERRPPGEMAHGPRVHLARRQRVAAAAATKPYIWRED